MTPPEPLWDAKRMGEACKRNAERRAAMRPKPSFDAIVKFAYEATLAEMRDDYEAERRKRMPAPTDDIRELVDFYVGELSHRPSARLLVERVRLWLDSLLDEAAPLGGGSR